MKLDITNLTMPEPEAVALLKSEVRRLRAALAALADQDATLSVQGGNVIVDGTLTAEERAAVMTAMHAYGWENADEECAKIEAAIHGLLERFSLHSEKRPISETPTLTDAERAAIESCIADDEAATAYARADTLRELLKRLGSDRYIGG